MRFDHLAAINQARHQRRAVVLVTNIGTGESEIVIEGEPSRAEIAASVESAFLSGRSALVDVAGERLFFNVHVPPPRIVVIGAVHISQALAAMAAIADFDVSIIDPRSAFATAARFGDADLVADWPEDVLKARPLDAYTALVAITHDPKIDDLPLAEALRTGCFYVGALGSRKTHAKRVERLLAAGVTDDQIARIDAPIGLDIGARTPVEIAVAILGAIIAAFRKRDLLRP